VALGVPAVVSARARVSAWEEQEWMMRRKILKGQGETRKRTVQDFLRL
jgi:hypothetical protein